ncbi:efflux RND transporter periplasmic adaptor subunit [Thiomonas sp. FB-6]|uniref:efflux RND transporter periplasmic adaptor subunit n=1 Tax=Thiomonas sp. FB-6 TaxID=1158291 RepID=UPI0003A91471|nr:efflux RND transporter periplasmic adaptor subunit [Thiomonas sp. FB-6]
MSVSPGVSPRAGHGRARSLRMAAALAALVLAGVAGVAWWAARRQPAVQYLTAPVSRGDVTRSVHATGTVNPVLTVLVGSYVSGVIQSQSCDFNTRVHKGQLCARIDPRPYQTVVDENVAQLAVARAQLDKDRAALDYARINERRQTSLIGRGVVSQDVVDAARNALAQARAQISLDQAAVREREAALEAARVNLGYTDIVSPVDGTVVSRNVTIGQTVAASFQTPTLFLIATDLTRMQVDTNVSESDIGSVHDADPARFTVEAYPGQPFEARVVQVRQAPQAVQNVITYDVVLGVDNAALRLKPGMTATVDIVTEQRRGVLRVPDQALRFEPGALVAPQAPERKQGSGARVWVLREGKPVAVPLRIGLDDDSYAEVLGGQLRQGDAVIVGEQRGASGAGARAGTSLRLGL